MNLWASIRTYASRANAAFSHKGPVPPQLIWLTLVAYLTGLVQGGRAIMEGLASLAAMAVQWGAHGRWARLAVCFAIVGIGAVFRWLREHRRRHYGAWEIAFATSIVWYACDRVPSREVAFATVVGALYVIVRGLDNFMAAVGQEIASATAPARAQAAASAAPPGGE